MAGEWEKVRLGDLVKITHGWPFKSECFTGERTGRPIIVSIGNFQYTGGFRFESTTIKEYTANYPKEYELTPGDILLVMTCQTAGGEILGIPGRIPDDGNIYLHNQRMGKVVIKDQRRIDPGFVYYLALWSDFNRELCVSASGTKILHTAPVRIEAFEFNIPPRSDQKAIAAVLGALDDKIELNRRMNATLEAMARALFQSWFVDFDPVRAKLDGRKPADLDDATAALFPDSFQDSEAGHIPKGWPVGKVIDVATLNRGAINPGDFPTETFDHFSLPAFDNGRTPKVELGSAIMSNKFTVTPNSVLLSKLNPHIPRIWLPDLHASRRSVCSTEFIVACSKPGVSREYLFSLFTSSAFAGIYGTLVTGTTGSHQRIRPESVLDMKIVIPSVALIGAFTAIAKPMFDRINRNTEQSRTLAALRDTLLPKLLSGELSVAGVEQGEGTDAQ
jgi:type I restriction enzyme, S subunit